ncbi:MAG: 4Fe-4S ferredoxin [Candidatus Thermoplasmatota archaeon]|nr:4Fe-4S ferredoxin [Euryarchaeota archaeon]MBU4031212.1 4Fe-4S ferredoxin [Candidatus Thermoplasmatota archaeon]MBU4070936.1 4Fe-4S ferredoxin [Candidatus Thermoplasmatota archaeon]MBU4144005.1 4Fe-4S ferredoxin [Candidatus Thermoplasmatota archaeon]MBU4591881.1 4Fe-4S ferredoxin [Candidatus Thermoplasmatota archaeon]
MSEREIIIIDEGLCNGCGQCIPNCHEGALKIVDGKARLISDLFCDGLGACIGHCPEGAISIEVREAVPYDEKAVMKTIVLKGPNTIREHLQHLKDHNAVDLMNQGIEYLEKNNISVPDGFKIEEKLACGCCADEVKTIETATFSVPTKRRTSRLGTWPVQIHLVPAHAPFLKNADILVAADCVPFAYPEFHEDFLRGRVALVGCPKLDDAGAYLEKLTDIFAQNDVKSVTAIHMEVPCCFGLTRLVKTAMERAGRNVEFNDVTISSDGKILN